MDPAAPASTKAATESDALQDSTPAPSTTASSGTTAPPTNAPSSDPLATTVAPNGAQSLPLQPITTVEDGPDDEQIAVPNDESLPVTIDIAEPVGTPVDVGSPAVGSAPQEVRSRPLRFALYGDSIGEEIYPYLAFFASTVRSVVIDRNVYGGTNACDWFDEAERDARSFRPDIVITMFVGNDFTPCTRPTGHDETPGTIAWRTVADTNALASLFPESVPVYRVGYARSAMQQEAFDASGAGNKVDGIRYLLAMSSSNRMHYIDGSEVLLEDGRYTDTLPCSILDGTNCGDDGRIQVRAAGRVHLCPAVSSSQAGVINRCPVHSSGAARLAVHILSFVLPASQGIR